MPLTGAKGFMMDHLNWSKETCHVKYIIEI